MTPRAFVWCLTYGGLVLLLYLGPAILLGFLWRVFRKAAKKYGTVAWRASVYGITIPFLTFLVLSVYALLHLWLDRTDPMSVLFGGANVWIMGLPIAAISFVVVWGIAIVFLSMRSKSVQGSQPAPLVGLWWSMVGWVVIVITLGSVAGWRYGASIQAKAKSASTIEELKALLENPWAKLDDKLVVAIVYNDHCTPEMLRDINQRFPRVRMAVSYNPKTPPDLLRAFSAPDQGNLHYSVATNPSTPPDALRALASRNDEVLRINLSQNPSLPHDVMLQFAKDFSSTVRSSLLRNKSLTDDILQLLTSDTDQGIRYAVSKELEKRRAHPNGR